VTEAIHLHADFQYAFTYISNRPTAQFRNPEIIQLELATLRMMFNFRFEFRRVSPCRWCHFQIHFVIRFLVIQNSEVYAINCATFNNKSWAVVTRIVSCTCMETCNGNLVYSIFIFVCL